MIKTEKAGLREAIREVKRMQRAGTGQTAAAVCADGAGSGRVFGTFLEMTNMPAAEEKGIAYGR